MNKEQLQLYYDKFIHLMTRLEHQNVKIIGLSTKYKSIQVGRAIANRLGIVEGIPTPAEVADGGTHSGMQFRLRIYGIL